MSKLTKKDYNRLVKVVKETTFLAKLTMLQREILVDELMRHYIKPDGNERFNAALFRNEACERG